MIGGRWGKRGLLAVVLAFLLAAAAPTAAGAAAGLSPVEVTEDTPVWDAAGDAPARIDAIQVEPPDNNTTVAHRNPSEVRGDDSLADVEALLAREMAGRLSESADLSREDRERARELVGNDSEYAELAEQYAEVTNRTGTDAGSAEDFTAVGQLQREFFADVEEYHRVHELYRDARANDETDRTVRLAHGLERRAAAVNRTAARLNESYADVSADEQGNLRNATRAVGEMRANVTRTQQTVRDQTLVRTELSVRATQPTGSFTDPVGLAGRLQTADGEAVADENVTLHVGNRTIDATTDGDGRFEVAYRPTHAAVGERSREVAFRPGNESTYLQADATVEFGVRQVTPDVTVSNRTEAVRYNETLAVDGTVAAEGVGVPGVPVVVTVDDVRIGQIRTRANGSFDLTERLPANVSNGSRTIQVQVVPENASAADVGPGSFGSESAESRSALGSDSASESDPAAAPAEDVAIAPANGTAPLTVETTATSLSISDVRTFNGTAFVAGRLTTDGGEPIPNRTVELRIDGQSVGTAATNATGNYATTVGLPSRLVGSDSTVRVAAAYSQSDGNLDPADADRTATVGSTGAVVSGRHLRLGAAGLLVAAALGAFGWRVRSTGSETSDRATDPDGNVEAGEREFDDTRGRSAEVLLDSAAEALADDRFDAAVVAAYWGVRKRLGESNDSPDHRTHWEFYVARRDDSLSEERLRELERLTELYERAAFAAASVPKDEAAEAVDVAASIRPERGDPGDERSETNAPNAAPQ